MHEMSLASSLLELLREEMLRNGADQLVEARVCFGGLTHIHPPALEQAFTVLLAGGPWQTACLTFKELGVKLQCGNCNETFKPPLGQPVLIATCPFCGEEGCHNVLQGKELYLDCIKVSNHGNNGEPEFK